MPTKYVVVPGVLMVNGRKKYVSGPELIFLYKVRDEDCVIWDEGDEEPIPEPPPGGELVWLFPNAHGNYTLPEAKS